MQNVSVKIKGERKVIEQASASLPVTAEQVRLAAIECKFKPAKTLEKTKDWIIAQVEFGTYIYTRYPFYGDVTGHARRFMSEICGKLYEQGALGLDDIPDFSDKSGLQPFVTAALPMNFLWKEAAHYWFGFRLNPL